MYVCMYVYPLAYLKNHVQISRNFCILVSLPVTVARSFSDDNAICVCIYSFVNDIIFSERETLKFSAIFLRHLVPWPPIDIHGKFYGDRPRGTPPSGGLKQEG